MRKNLKINNIKFVKTDIREKSRLTLKRPGGVIRDTKGKF